MSILDLFTGSDHGAGAYGGQADGYQQQANNSTGAVGGQISQYSDLANTGRSEFNQYDPQYNAAIDARAQHLEQNPFTQQSHDAYVANRMGGTTAAYNTARASLAKNSYLSGLDTPDSGGASSAYAGADAALQNAQLGRLNAADNGYADWANNEQNTRQSDLVSLLGGARSDARSQWNSGLGGEQAGNEWMAGQYDGDAQRYYGLQKNAQDEQHQDFTDGLSLYNDVASHQG